MMRVEHKHYPRDRQNVARYLVSRGCQTDILMAAALGDMELVRHHLKIDPACIGMKVSEEWFPKQNPRAEGTIYFRQLGAHRTAHVVARDFGHEDVFRLLVEHTPLRLRLALACKLGDEATFREFIAEQPDVVTRLSEEERRKLPDAAQSNNTNAVRLMLEAGWPVDMPGERGAPALHWAAFNGNAEMTREILKFHPSLECKSRKNPGSALSWGIFGSGNEWRRETGDYAGTVRGAAGCRSPAAAGSGGTGARRGSFGCAAGVADKGKGRSASIGDFALIIVFVAHPRKTGAELPPSTTGTAKRQEHRRYQRFTNMTQSGAKDLPPAFVAGGQRRQSRFCDRHPVAPDHCNTSHSSSTPG